MNNFSIGFVRPSLMVGELGAILCLAPMLSEGSDVIRFSLMRVAADNVVGVAMTTLAFPHGIQCILYFDYFRKSMISVDQFNMGSMVSWSPIYSLAVATPESSQTFQIPSDTTSYKSMDRNWMTLLDPKWSGMSFGNFRTSRTLPKCVIDGSHGNVITSVHCGLCLSALSRYRAWCIRSGLEAGVVAASRN